MNYMRVARAACVVAVVLAAAPARGLDLRLASEPLRLDLTETLVFAYHGDNGNRTYADDRYYEAQSRLNLGLAWRQWLFNVRVDSYGFGHTPSCDAEGVCTAPSPPPRRRSTTTGGRR